MERIILYGIGIAWLICPVCAEYYEITTNVYTPGLTLDTGDELYMTNGGFDSLTLMGSSLATIEGTSPLEEGAGGIWFLSLAGMSYLELSGGEMQQLDFYNDATAVLAGGAINQIRSNQQAAYWDNDNGVWIQTPHIQIACQPGTCSYDEVTSILTGRWLADGTAFNIQLIDVENYSPVIENIQFIPEPATLALLIVGSIVLHRKKHHK